MPAADLAEDLSILWTRLRVLEQALSDSAFRAHGGSHELGRDDEIRYAVQNQGVRLASKHRELNFSTGLTAVTDTANQRITITASAGWSPAVVSKSAAYTAVKNDVVLCTSTFTVTLTASATVGTGGIIVVKNTGTGMITVTPAGAETIDGVAGSLTLAPNDAYTLITNGSNGFII